jgi:hypothetical protein
MLQSPKLPLAVALNTEADVLGSRVYFALNTKGALLQGI